jgi:hypothetical protein
MQELQHTFGCQITRIGTVMAKSHGVQVVDARGKVVHPMTRGFDHFRSGR